VADRIVVVIAAPERLEAMRTRIAADEVLAFAESDVLRALDAIVGRHPGRVVLERQFAGSSRGMALVNRLHADPSLQPIDVQVVAVDLDRSSAASRRPPDPPAARKPQPAAAAAAAQPLDTGGTRRTPRATIAQGVHIVIDGTAVRLIDLSHLGAQVVSTGALKPGQRLRVTLVDATGAVRCTAQVVWARFELPAAPQMGAHYRAGLEFLEANAEAVKAFATRHGRLPESPPLQ
jgi:hypothetical protein